jgi:DNA polymerase-1
MMKATLVKLHGELSKNPQWDAHIILQVYDEVVVECREEYAEDCAKLIEQCMLTAFPLNRVPLECEVKIGANYAEVK